MPSKLVLNVTVVENSDGSHTATCNELGLESTTSETIDALNRVKNEIERLLKFVDVLGMESNQLGHSVDPQLFKVTVTVKKKDERRPVWPMSVAPVQVRIIPLTDRNFRFADIVARALESGQVRVDVDDRTETTQAKVTDAAREWIPIVIIIGDQEAATGELVVRFRRPYGDEQKVMRAKKVLTHVLNETKGSPKRPMTLPKRVSRRTGLLS